MGDSIVKSGTPFKASGTREAHMRREVFQGLKGNRSSVYKLSKQT